MVRLCRTAALLVGLLACAVPALAQGPVSYRLSMPSPEQGWIQVEMRLTAVPPGRVELLMSRSSPGRYATHNFARNVSNVEVADAAGAPVAVTRPSSHVWRIVPSGSSLVVRYRIEGDRIDGTYLGIDGTHAHINMPATLMWARGFEAQPVSIVFDTPSEWKAATQLFPGTGGKTFTAPNLQYLMDSPTELGVFDLSTFDVSDGTRSATFRMAVHHRGTPDEVRSLAADTERIVREATGVFGELPAFDNGTYTFIADYLPTVIPDGMEHRNSTIVTSAGSIRADRADIRGTLSHEFFHVWNVERIRPRTLEPFNFAEANISSELWMAEGFTQYYGALVLARSGLMTTREFAGEMGELVRQVLASPARLSRTLEDMSRMAVVVDGAAIADVAGLRTSFLSYYTWGGAVALGLDLTLRDRSEGRVTLDTFMRLLWERHGKPGGTLPGHVDRPYTTADLTDALATVSGSRSFADDFFSRYIQGREVMDYDRLLGLVGFVRGPDGRNQPLVPAEETGGALTTAQQRLRSDWLRSRTPASN